MKTFPIMLKLQDRLAVVIGGGQVGLRKVRALQRAGAKVRLVASSLSDKADNVEKTSLDGVDIRRQQYSSELLEGAFLVFACTDSSELNAQIADDARKIGAIVNAADQPEDCDFFLPAVAADRDIVVAVGTGGASPALAAKLKDYISAALPRHVGEFAAALADAREQLAELVADPARRMEIMRRLAEDDIFEEFLAKGPAAVRTICEQYMNNT